MELFLLDFQNAYQYQLLQLVTKCNTDFFLISEKIT